MIEIIYKSSNGHVHNLLGEKMRITEGNFHSYSWKRTTVKTVYGKRIIGFDKDDVVYNIVLHLRGSLEERKDKLNQLRDDFEYDIAHLTPGRIHFGNYYADVFVEESKTEVSDVRSTWSKNEIKIFLPHGSWIQEETFSYKIHGTQKNNPYLDYPFGYPFDYTGPVNGVSELLNKHYTDTDFKMTIHGPVVNPKIIIDGYPYLIRTTVKENEYLTINSKENTVIRVKQDGTQVNEYDNRNFEHSVFRKIPPGNHSVIWPGNFGVDITLIKERSEPEW